MEARTREREKTTKVVLPYHAIYICEICGESFENREKAQEHEALGVREVTDLKDGDVVQLFKTQTGDTGSITELSKEPEGCTVYRIFYTKSHRVYNYKQQGSLEPHTLCLDLRQSIEKGIAKPWYPESIGGVCMWMLTHKDFLLFQKGNRQELITAGLLKETRPKLSKWHIWAAGV